MDESDTLPDIPIEVLALSRAKWREWNKGGNKGEKADVVICGRRNFGWSKEIRCKECKNICYYTEHESLDLKKKNIKKICIDCALNLEKYRKHLNEDQIKILEIGR